MLTLRHQDGDIHYQFVSGGFHYDGQHFYLSIEAHAINEEAFPDIYCLTLDRIPLANGFNSQEVVVSTNSSDKPPNIYVYTTFHAAEVNGRVLIEVTSPNKLLATLSITSEDVNYYDERAKPNTLSGKVELSAISKNQLWLP
ncbi:hypothetical protein V8J88_21455 [Massilia sp. W12]|uniref:hypothetical protein n=1 Tax=Massilia sp. W12 TaxID=3126507 RepID=UPI0030D27EA6